MSNFQLFTKTQKRQFNYNSIITIQIIIERTKKMLRLKLAFFVSPGGYAINTTQQWREILSTLVDGIIWGILKHPPPGFLQALHRPHPLCIMLPAS